MKLESEIQGQDYQRKRQRQRRNAIIAQTWTRWYCWGCSMPDDYLWSCGGMIWRYKGETGTHYVGHS